MGKTIKLALTVEQALGLREMAGSSDQWNCGDDRRDYLTKPMIRAMQKLEDAIEAVRGEFANRMTAKQSA